MPGAGVLGFDIGFSTGAGEDFFSGDFEQRCGISDLSDVITIDFSLSLEASLADQRELIRINKCIQEESE
jgi:hypothetical protein